MTLVVVVVLVGHTAQRHQEHCERQDGSDHTQRHHGRARLRKVLFHEFRFEGQDLYDSAQSLAHRMLQYGKCLG